MPYNYNIDFHCHPVLRSTSTSENLNNINLWDVSENYKGSKVIERWISIQLSDIGRTSQTHLNGYIKSNTNIVFDALYPIEKGWLNFKTLPSILLGKTIRENIFRISSEIGRAHV